MTIDDIMQLMNKQILPNRRNLNVSLPPGVVPEDKKIIQQPIPGFFFKDAFSKMCFQRKSEIPKADFMHLSAIFWCVPNTPEGEIYRNLIKAEIDQKRPDPGLPENIQIKEEATWED